MGKSFFDSQRSRVGQRKRRKRDLKRHESSVAGESLESRRLLAIDVVLSQAALSFTGANGNQSESLYLRADGGGLIEYSTTGVLGTYTPDLSTTVGIQSLSITDATSITVDMRDGADLVYIDASLIAALEQAEKSITVQLGAGAGDQLIGPTRENATVWSLTATDAGQLAAVVNFTGAEKLKGGAGSDTFQLASTGAVSGEIDGGGGEADTLDYGARSTVVTVDLGTGSATSVGSFKNLTAVAGGTGTDDILRGPVTEAVWSVSGANSGDVNDVDFSAFETLVGADSVSDTFAFDVSGSVTHDVDGGTGGHDSLVFRGGTVPTVQVAPNTTAGVHTATYESRSVSYLGLDAITNASGNDVTVYGSGLDDLWTLADDASNAGNMKVSGASGQFAFLENGSLTNGLSFASPNGSLFWEAMRGDDVITLSSLDTSFSGANQEIQIDLGDGLDEVLLHAALVNQVVADSVAVEIIGGAGEDQVQGADLVNSWSIAGANTGTLGSDIDFSSVEHLVGGSNNDTFTFANGSSLSGTIGGGGGTTNAVNFSGLAGPISLNLGTGTVTGVVLLQGINSITGSSSNNDTLLGILGDTTWTLSGANAGTVSGTQQQASGQSLQDVAMQFTFSSFENLTGRTSEDTFVMGASGSVTGTVDGGGGDDEIDYSARSSAVAVNLTAQTATHTGGWANIESWKGSSAGSDTLTGPAVDSTWLVTALDQGTVNSVAFQSFEDLTGSAAADDAFVVSVPGGVTGTIDGGSGGHDGLSFSKSGQPLTVLLPNTAAGTHSITYDGVTVDYKQLDAIVSTAAGIATISLSGGSESFTLRDVVGDATKTRIVPNGSSLQFIDDQGQIASSYSFATPSNGFVLEAGAGQDTIHIDSSNWSYDGPLEIHGDHLTVTGHIISDAAPVTISSKGSLHISGAIIDTIERVGNNLGNTAGNIKLESENITIDGGAQLLARPTANNSTYGQIDILAIDSKPLTAGQGFYNREEISTQIDIDQATIEGGQITIKAQGEQKLFLDDEGKSDLELMFTKAVNGLLKTLTGIAVIAGTSIAEVDAEINVGSQTDITGTDVLIHTDSTTQALSSPVGIVVGVAVSIADTRSVINMAGDITATNDLDIRANSKSTVDAYSSATSVKGIGNAVAISMITSETTAHVTDQADLVVGGDLTLEADTIDQNRTSARTTTGADGKVGIAVSVSHEKGDTSALLDGRADVAGNVSIEADSRKDPLPATAMWVVPTIAGGVAADAGTGITTTGDLLDSTKSYGTSLVTGPLKSTVMGWINQKLGRKPSTSSAPPYALAGSVAVAEDTNNVTARIGDGTATGATDRADVEADGTVRVVARVEARPDVSSSAASKIDPEKRIKNKTDAEGSAAALAVAYGDYENNALAFINSDAHVDAKSTLTVQAQSLNDYEPSQGWGANLVAPFRESADHQSSDGTQTVNSGDIVQVSQSHTAGGDVGNWYEYSGATNTLDLSTEDYTNEARWKPRGNSIASKADTFLSTFTTYLNDNLGLDDNLADSWSQATANAKGKNKLAVAGSASALELNQNANAYVASGARVNQDTDFRSANNGNQNTQTVVIESTAVNEGYHLGGNLKLPGFGGSTEGVSFKFSGTGFGSTSDGNAVGASVFVVDYMNESKATIQDGVQLYADSLEVDANSETVNVIVGISGGQSGDIGFNGVVAAVDVDNTTIAQIQNGASVTIGSSTVHEGATSRNVSLLVEATDDTIVVDVLGGVAISDHVGVGATVGVNDVSRDTQAVIGNLWDDNANDQRGSLTVGGPSLVNAGNEGFIGGFAVAGAKVSSNPSNVNNNGTGVTNRSGSSGDDPGKLPNNQRNYDSVIAELKAKFGESSNASGGAGTNKGKSGIGISGAVVLNQVDDNARSYIRNSGAVNVTSGSLSVTGSASADVVSLAGAVALALGKSSTSNKGIGGAVGLNFISGKTEAYVDGATSVSSHGLTIDATNDGAVVAITAGVAGASGRQGIAIAGSVGVVQTSNDITGALRNTTATITGPVQVLASDDSTLVMVSGAGAFGGKVGVGAAMSMSDVQNDVTAEINTVSNFKHTGDMDVRATNDALLVAVTGAGAVATSGGGGGFGAAGTLSINFLENSLTARIVDTTTTMDSAGDIHVNASDEGAVYAFTGAFGAGKTLGLGAAFALNDFNNSVIAAIEGSTLRTTNGELTVQADEKVLSVTVSVGGAGAQTLAVAGGFAVNQLANHVDAHVTGSTVHATGAMLVKAYDRATLVAVTGGGAAAATAAAGASVSVNLIDNEVYATIDGSTLTTTGGTLDVLATSELLVVAVGLGGAGAASYAAGGSVTVNEASNEVKATVINGSQLSASGNVGIRSDDESTMIVVSGAGAGAGTAAIGAAVATVQLENDMFAIVDGSSVTSTAGSVSVTSGFEAPPSAADLSHIPLGTSGINMPTTNGSQIVNVTFAGAGAGSFAGGAAISLNWLKNRVHALADNNATLSGHTGVTIAAADNPEIDSAAAIGVGAGNTAIGAAISYNYLGGDPGNPSRSIPNDPLSSNAGSVAARVSGASTSVTSAAGPVTIYADSKPSIINATVGGAGAGSVAVSGSVSINFMRTIVETAVIGGADVSAHDDANISATATPLMIIVAGNGSGAGNTAGSIASATNDMQSSITTRVSGSGTTVTSTDGDVQVLAEIQRPSSLPNINVNATLDAQIWAFAVSGSGAGSAALAGSTTQSWIDNTVSAQISEGASVSANNGAVDVKANDRAMINSLAGAGAGAGSGSVGASVAYNYLGNPNTNPDDSQHVIAAYVDAATVTANQVSVLATSDATINNLTVAGSGAGSFALGGAVSLNWINKTLDARVSGATTMTTDTGNIEVRAEDDSTIRSVAGGGAGAGSVAIGAAAAYNEIDNTILARIDPSGSPSAAPTIQAAADLWLQALSDSTIWTISAGIAVAGSVGVAGSASSNLVSNTIDAFIRSASVTATSDVLVLADNDNEVSSYVGTLGGGGTVGAGGSAVVNQLQNNTRAFVTEDAFVAAGGQGTGISVKKWADDDAGTESTETIQGLAIIADSNEDLEVIAVAAGLGGQVGIGANVVVNLVSDTTLAYVNDSRVNTSAAPGGTVKVRAHQDTKITSGGGALGVGLGVAGAGAAVDTNILSNTTRASIADEDSATDVDGVYAGNGLEVGALSRENVLTATVGAGIGLYAGVAGASSAVKTTSVTEAYIRRADVDVAGVLDVVANSRSAATFGVGSAAGGLVGAGGAVAVGLYSGRTSAYVVGSTIDTTSDVHVEAKSAEDVELVAGTASVGAGAVAGAISVISTSSTTEAYIGSLVVGQTAVLSDINAGRDVRIVANNSTSIADRLGSLAAGGVGVGASVDVVTVKNQVDAHIGTGSLIDGGRNVKVNALTNREIDSTVIAGAGGASTGIAGSVSVISIGRGIDSTGNSQASPANSALSSSFSGSMNGMNTSDTRGQRANAAANSQLFTFQLGVDASISDTTAYIGEGAIVNAGVVDVVGAIEVTADDTLAIEAITGAVGLGYFSAGVGGAVTVVHLNGGTTAYVAKNATLRAEDDVTVRANFSANDVDLWATGGAAGAVGLGAQVAILEDESSQSAYLADGTSSSDAVKILQADELRVEAVTERSYTGNSKGATVGALAAGAAVATISIGGTTEAYLGDYAQVGQTSSVVSTVAVNASNLSKGATDVLAVAAGIGAGSGNLSKVEIDPTVRATVGPSARVRAHSADLVTDTDSEAGDIKITASFVPQANAEALGVNAGALAVGVSEARAIVDPTIEAKIETSSQLRAETLSLAGTLGVPEATYSAKSYATGAVGGLVGANATLSRAENTGNVLANVGDQALLLVSERVDITAQGDSNQSADGTSITAGLVAAGGNDVRSTSDITTNATLGIGTQITAGDAIGGLQDGQIYYVVLNDNPLPNPNDPNSFLDGPDRIRLVDNFDDAMTLGDLQADGATIPPGLSYIDLSLPTRLNAGHRLRPITVKLVDAPTFDPATLVDPVTNFINVGDGFGYYTGQAVIYNKPTGLLVNVSATSDETHMAESTAGSGGVVAGAAALSEVNVDGTTNALLIDDTNVNDNIRTVIDASSLTIEAAHTTHFDSQTNTIQASAVGFSGSWATNTIDSTVTAKLGNNAQVTTESLVVDATNTGRKNLLGDGDYNVEAGSGGVLQGNAAESETDVAHRTYATIGDDVDVTVTGDLYSPGELRVSSVNDFEGSDDVRLDSGGVIVGSGATSAIRADVNDAVSSVGERANLTTVGDIDIVTRTRGVLKVEPNVHTYGLASAAVVDGLARLHGDNQVQIGDNAVLDAKGDVNLFAGRDQEGTRSAANITSHGDELNASVLPIDDLSSHGEVVLNHEVVVGDQASIRSARDINLIAERDGERYILAYGSGKNWMTALASGIDAMFGSSGISEEFQGGSSTSELTATVTVNGTVEVGTMKDQSLKFGLDENLEFIPTEQTGGMSFSITTENVALNLKAEMDYWQGQLRAYQGDAVQVAAYNAEINRVRTQMEQLGLVDLVSLPNGSTETVYKTAFFSPFITVNDVWAQSGTIQVGAFNLLGSGDLISPSDVNVTIENDTPATLRVKRITIPDSAGGRVRFNGQDVADAAAIGDINANDTIPTLTVQSAGGNGPDPEIHITSTYDEDDPGNPAQFSDFLTPDVYVSGDITNVLGSVAIHSQGSVLSQASINAATLDIRAGRDFVQSFGPPLFHVGGNPGTFWQSVANILQTEGPKHVTLGQTGSWSFTANAGDGGIAGSAISNRLSTPSTSNVIAANNVFISATYLNINGTVQSGMSHREVTIEASEQAAINTAESIGYFYRAGWRGWAAYLLRNSALTTTDYRHFRLPASSSDNIIVYYDVVSDQLELEGVSVQGGYMELFGQVVSTGNGKINVLDGYGDIKVVNQTSYPLVTGTLDAGRGVQGRLKITDTSFLDAQGRPLISEYYRENGQMKKYSYRLAHNDATDTLEAVNASTLALGTNRTATYAPKSGTRFFWAAGQNFITRTTTTYAQASWAGIDAFAADPDNVYSGPTQELLQAVPIREPGEYFGSGSNPDYTYSFRRVNTDAGSTSRRNWTTSTWYGKKTYYVEETVTQGQKDIHAHSIRADRTINIEFQGKDAKDSNLKVEVQSTGDVILNGSIANPQGNTSINTAGRIRSIMIRRTSADGTSR